MRLGAENVTDGEAVTLGAFRVCLRGRFEVTDPAAVRDLMLPELQFHGGVVVYLNGREVARGFLPEGRLEANTAAAAYPDEARLAADGRAIPAEKGRKAKEAAQELAAREASRTRRLGPIRLSLDTLRKGVNVLAIEVRRSPSHPKGWRQWQPIKLEPRSIALRAIGAGIVLNARRPKGLRVWVEDINDRVPERDWADPCEPVGPVRIVAARNGSFGGIVVIASTSPLKDTQVVVSDLKAVRGDATIAPSSVELFSARLDGHAYMRTNWFDGLAPGVPADSPVLQIRPYGAAPINDAATLPVYVRFNVPKDATHGDYRGSVTVRAAGAEPVGVPVELYVSPWTLPDPRDYRTYVGHYQPPTSVAMQYKVDEWSEQHWKLLDKSFALLARTGNKFVNVCIVDQTQFGSGEGMVYSIRKADGACDYDFTVSDRSVALARKHFGTLDYVALQAWHSGGWDTRGADQKNTVTVIDPVTKKREHVQVPKFDTDEARKFWRPVLEACRQHLAKVGLENAMCLGILSDGTAPSAVFKMFDDVWPGGGPARRTRGLHMQREDMKPYRTDRGGWVVVLHEHCDGSPMLTVGDQLTGLSTYRGAPVTAYFRFSGFETLCTLNGYRLLADNALFLREQGIGRIGFDFWDVEPRPRGSDRERHIYNRFPHSSCSQRATVSGLSAFTSLYWIGSSPKALLHARTWAGMPWGVISPVTGCLCQARPGSS